MATKVVSVLTGGTNSHETTAEEINALYTDFLSDGIVGAVTNTSGVAPATGNFAVNAQGTPDMTVAVSQGEAYVTGTPTGGNSQRVRVSMWSSENVTIASNSTGGTRYDHIYIKLDPDKLANPNTAGDDVATLVTSRSTSASTDNGTPPTYGYKIAVVTVANGASSISNSNITDSRVRTGAQAADLGVGTAQIANGSITPAKLALGAATATVLTNEATTSTSFTDLTTTSDTVTVTIPSTGMALIILSARQVNAGGATITSFAASGANTIAASDNNAILGNLNNLDMGASYSYLLTGLTAGSTTFKMKYRVTVGTGSFSNRRITVIPLG